MFGSPLVRWQKDCEWSWQPISINHMFCSTGFGFFRPQRGTNMPDAGHCAAPRRLSRIGLAGQDKGSSRKKKKKKSRIASMDCHVASNGISTRKLTYKMFKKSRSLASHHHKRFISALPVMPLTVRPAAESDLPRSIAIEKRAYGPNKSSPVFFPGGGLKLEDRIAVMTTRIREEPASQCIKVVDTELEDKGDEAMIAFALWFIWSGDLRPSFPQRKWGAGTNLEACEAFFGEIDRQWWARFEGKPHLCKCWKLYNVYKTTISSPRPWPDLKLLHTDPDHQKRGAGGQCLKWGTAEADRLGLVSYLEASEEGRPLYEKYGFKEVDRVVVDLTKWGGTEPATAYLMLRQPVLN
ncbi:uncharacterized protein Triagg1_3287 [Trichoderma aggressivum f. europaeum]|uniref:N-acetyltransferase domain-containing protein n=1 Tax=Trichoderma aggressivum f. europaeum TaxID=173218 RepID=A0AAE1IGP1_9HYPO|nr:hypothetical protein Triagg1_3287 [Trichoderma aggressivum f. europaeum]